MNIEFDSIVIDAREKDSIKPSKDFFKNAEIYNLDSGDYAFIKGNKQILFEYKTILDFISSIIDGRVFRQCYQMNKNSYKSYLIIHGDFANIKSLLELLDVVNNVDLTSIKGVGDVTTKNIKKNIIGERS